MSFHNFLENTYVTVKNEFFFFFLDRQDKKMCGNGKCIKKSADYSLIGYDIFIC